MVATVWRPCGATMLHSYALVVVVAVAGVHTAFFLHQITDVNV